MVKKISAIVLALVLCLTAMVVPVSAAPAIEGSATQGVLFEYLDKDGNELTSVNPGQVITVKIYATVNQANQALKAAKFQIWFNSDIYEYVEGSQEWVGPVAYLNAASTTEVITSGTVYDNVFNKLTTEEAAYGWNAALYMQFGLDSTVEGSYLVQENAETEFATAQFKVKDTVTPGTAAPLGAPQATTYVKRGAVYNYVQTTNIAVPTKTGLITLTTPGTDFVVKVPTCAEHTWDNGVVTTPPTCAEDGVKTYTCSVCGETKTAVEPATGVHTPDDASKENEVHASCNTAGSYDEVVKCSVCGEEISRTPVTVPATGDHNFAVEKERKDATCTEDGYIIWACGCGEVNPDVEVIASLGHKYDSAVTAPTCTADGYTTFTCSVCNDSYVADEVASLGHTDGEVVVENEVAATCTVDGSYDNVVYCTVCQAEVSRETITVEAAGHTEEEIPAVDKTNCEEVGYTAGTKCSVCGEVLVAPVEVPATNHDYKMEVLRQPSCSKPGNARYTCNVCGHNYREDIPSKNHTREDGTSAIVEIPAIPATCKNPGYTAGAKCELCNTQTIAPTQIPTGDHTWDEGVVTEPTYSAQGYTTYTCTECGEVEKRDYTDKLEASFTVSIREPSITSIRCMDTIVLHTEIEGGSADDVTIKWTADNENFTMTELEDGKLEITSMEDGYTVFTATVYDANGNAIGSDTIEMRSKANIWGKIGGFFRSLFGSTLYYNY